MSLDITAYSQLKDTGHPLIGTWTKGIAGIPGNIPEFAKRCVEFSPGNAFEYSGKFDTYIGSYSYYEAWREKLAKLAGYHPNRWGQARTLKEHGPRPKDRSGNSSTSQTVTGSSALPYARNWRRILPPMKSAQGVWETRTSCMATCNSRLRSSWRLAEARWCFTDEKALMKTMKTSERTLAGIIWRMEPSPDTKGVLHNAHLFP